jgi:hypothetical protein
VRWTERAEGAVLSRIAEAQPSARSLLLVLAAVNALSLALILAGGRVEAGAAVDAAFGWCPVPW